MIVDRVRGQGRSSWLCPYGCIPGARPRTFLSWESTDAVLGGNDATTEAGRVPGV